MQVFLYASVPVRKCHCMQVFLYASVTQSLNPALFQESRTVSISSGKRIKRSDRLNALKAFEPVFAKDFKTPPHFGATQILLRPNLLPFRNVAILSRNVNR
ncbi:hypothetical protein AVEN_89727-1 [Araneus ventricosus]|uniref:Uncharacterized protein n=1 Tax=Araneus ventricosus TaxID=182803 RepID=A0A4Y2WVR4_ARAVE|nr:hypothetical protein AVEN_89727-1 [Araneus ventricosus]